MATRRKSVVDVLASEDVNPPTEAPDKAPDKVLAEIPVDQIHVHPKNPRHNATADEEMVASIKEQGILVPGIVAPHPEGPDPDNGTPRWMLVDGHCRLDGALRAGLQAYPAIIRRDLTSETEQVKAMLLTGSGKQRRNLTPIEEAEGYQLLLDLKVKVPEIARDMGVSATLVRDRVKLLKLAPRLQEKTHVGQLTIDDALAIAALPAGEQTKVAKAAGSYNFRYEIEAAKRRVKVAAEHKQEVARLKGAGIPQREMPAGHTIHMLNDAEHGMVRLGATFSRAPEDHSDCLAFIANGDYVDIEYVCTNVAGHDEQLDEQQRAEREERERLDAEREARAEAESLAQRLRCDAVLEGIKPGVKLDPIVVGILRVFLPLAIEYLGYEATGFFQVLDLGADERWSTQGHHGWKDADHAAWARMLRRIETANPAELLQILVAVLLANTERASMGRNWSNGYEKAPLIYSTIAGYYQLLEQLEWSPTALDVEFRAIADNAGEPPEVEAAS